MVLIDEQLLLNNKKDVVLTHLYIKSKQNAQKIIEVNKDFKLTEAIRELLYYLYEVGGISSKAEYEEFTKLCIDNTGITTEKSVRNTLSKCVMAKIVKNVGMYKKELSEDWLPIRDSNDTIGLQYKITSKDAV